jgi:putative transport protein
MNLLRESLSSNQPVAAALLLISLIAAAGIALGSVRFRGIGLGTAGVLFAGLLAGHLGYHVDPTIRQFLQEFGLALFVYTIGLQLGPGFFASLKRQGLALNLMAAGVVGLGVILTLALSRWLGIDLAAAVGLFAGATTNTPALGAATDALRSTGAAPEVLAQPGVGYSIAYPGAIVGIIATLVALRILLRINPEQEAAAFNAERSAAVAPPERLNLEVTNPNLEGLRLDQITSLGSLELVISRIRRRGESTVLPASNDTEVHLGDTLLAVGPRAALKSFQTIVGRPSTDDLIQAPGALTIRRVAVTNRDVLGKTVGELNLTQAFGVVVTRVSRAETAFTAVPGIYLQFGDIVQLIGEPAQLDRAAQRLGNSIKALDQTNFVPFFLGLALGVVGGLIPFQVPGLPVPVRLGLAGGPLLVALLLSRIGRIGRLVWYMPGTANLAFRELGIVLFLACVGVKSGDKFADTLLSDAGLKYALAGMVITVVPILLAGWFGRRFLRQNFMTTCGLVAGSMTDPPALAFANNTAGSDAPSVAYATVYPLTMILRIVAGQVMVIALS